MFWGAVGGKAAAQQVARSVWESGGGARWAATPPTPPPPHPRGTQDYLHRMTGRPSWRNAASWDADSIAVDLEAAAAAGGGSQP